MTKKLICGHALVGTLYISYSIFYPTPAHLLLPAHATKLPYVQVKFYPQKSFISLIKGFYL